MIDRRQVLALGLCGFALAANPFGAGAAEGTASPLELSQHEVWHQLELGNRGTAPWTTGAALVTKGLLPLGQDLLTYTPVGGSALLPITVALLVTRGATRRWRARFTTEDGAPIDLTGATVAFTVAGRPGGAPVFEQLQASRSQMVHLFDELVRTIPEGVRLNSIKQSGQVLTLEGMAQSNARVSSYMRNLEESGWMANPDLSIIEAKGSDKGLPNAFSLKVTLKSPSAEEEAAAEPAAPAAAPAVAAGGAL